MKSLEELFGLAGGAVKGAYKTLDELFSTPYQNAPTANSTPIMTTQGTSGNVANKIMSGLGVATKFGQDVGQSMLKSGIALSNPIKGYTPTGEMEKKMLGDKKISLESVGRELPFAANAPKPLAIGLGLVSAGLDVVPGGKGTKEGAKKLVSEADDLVKMAKGKSLEEFIGGFGEKLYHGTPHKFDEFDLNKAGTLTDTGMFGKGFYFTKREGEAYGYSRGTGNIMEVYLDLKNPYIINKPSDIPDIKVPNETIDDMKNAAKNYSEKFTKYLQEKGYDGVIDNISGEDMAQYVVFDPSQIKTKKQLINAWNKANKKTAK